MLVGRLRQIVGRDRFLCVLAIHDAACTEISQQTPSMGVRSAVGGVRVIVEDGSDRRLKNIFIASHVEFQALGGTLACAWYDLDFVI